MSIKLEFQGCKLRERDSQRGRSCGQRLPQARAGRLQPPRAGGEGVAIRSWPSRDLAPKGKRTLSSAGV